MKRSFFFVMVAVVALLGSLLDAADKDKKTRLWKDATGQFEILAELIEKTETIVRLHTADGRELKVPIQRLSKADQDYLKTWKPANPFAGGTPIPGKKSTNNTPTTSKPPVGPDSKPTAQPAPMLPGTGNTLNLSTTPEEQAFVPDPQPKPPTIPTARVLVSKIDAYDKLSSPVLANGAEANFLLSIGRNVAGRPKETRGRIYSVSLKKKEAKLVWDLPHAVQVLAHHEESDRTLLVDKLDHFQRGGELVLVEGLTKGTVKTLSRRSLPGSGKPGFAPKVEWARLLSASRVAALVNQTLHVWDLPEAKLIYSINGVFSVQPPVFSGNQLYMAVPQHNKVVIIETATGKVRRSITTGNTLVPGAAFHPNGQFLAICSSNQYIVWDCQADAAVSQATTTGHLGAHPIHWIAPRMFLAHNGDLINMDLGMSIWKYYAPSSNPRVIVGNKVITTSSQNCFLASIEVPHRTAERSLEQLMGAGDDAMLVRPGSPVAIDVESQALGVNRDELRAALTKAVEKAGWKVSDQGPITLVAKIGRGPKRQLQYRSLRGFPRTISTATITPFTAKLEIRQGAKVLWTRSTINHVPSLLRLQKGETLQDAVNRYEKPNAHFFSSMDLPPRILKPEISKQVGMSSLTDGQWQDIKLTGPR